MLLSILTSLSTSLSKSFLFFVITYYLGLVGFSKPWKSISIISSISFIIFLINLLIKFSIKKYIIPTILIITVYLWSYIIERVPLYGSYVIYNPFSVFGLGDKFYGNKIDPIETCEGQVKEDISTDIMPHNILSKSFSIIIEMISAVIYVFGINWVGSKTVINAFTNIKMMLIRTGMKGMLGYVSKNKNLDKTFFNEYMQYRVYDESIISKISAIIRRYTLIGIDVHALDDIFSGIDYNNILIKMDANKFCEKRKEYFIRKKNNNVSIVEMWKWETLPYLYHWFSLSIISYIFYILFRLEI